MLAQAAHQSDGATSLQNQELLAPDEQALAPVFTPETRAVAATIKATPITFVARPPPPAPATLGGLHAAVQACAACPLSACATQAVNGAGPLARTLDAGW